jgi:hypothetical protein
MWKFALLFLVAGALWGDVVQVSSSEVDLSVSVFGGQGSAAVDAQISIVNVPYLVLFISLDHGGSDCPNLPAVCYESFQPILDLAGVGMISYSVEYNEGTLSGIYYEVFSNVPNGVYDASFQVGSSYTQGGSPAYHTFTASISSEDPSGNVILAPEPQTLTLSAIGLLCAWCRAKAR